MKPIESLGQEYRQLAVDLSIKLELLKLSRIKGKLEWEERQLLDKRIEMLYLEYLQAKDIGNRLCQYYTKKEDVEN